jgi:hypothetical protein
LARQTHSYEKRTCFYLMRSNVFAVARLS